MDDVAAISGRSCFSVIKTDGTLWAWGGGLSEDSENMEPIYMLDDVIAVSSTAGTVWPSGRIIPSGHSVPMRTAQWVTARRRIVRSRCISWMM